MNPALMLALKFAAVGIQIKANGLTGELRDRLTALNDELKGSILAPKPDGQPFTDADILALAAEHEAFMSGLLARHGQ